MTSPTTPSTRFTFPAAENGMKLTSVSNASPALIGKRL